MSKLQEIQNELQAKRGQLSTLFAKGYDTFTADEADQARQWNDELTALGKKRDEVKALDDLDQQVKAAAAADEAAVRNNRIPIASTQPEREPELKTIGDAFLESAAFKGFRPGMKNGPEVTIDRKTLLTLTGYSVQNVRTGRIEPAPLRNMHVADLIPQAQTNANAIVYMEETTTTNAAAAVAEGGTKPESALAFTERTVPVRKIATVLPVTDELMEDAVGLRDYINQRLRLFVQLTEDTELVTGSGVAPHLTGLLTVSGIQTQAKGADPVPDAIYKAMTLINVNAFLEADGAIFHPLDWQDIRLLRTADGIYIWGNPADAGPERIWGLNIAKTTAMTQNTALVGAFQYATQIFRRSEITLAVSSEHSTFFVENKQMLRAEERLALVCYRPLALCSVTGI